MIWEYPAFEWGIRLILAGILGGLIGLERGYRAKEAGLRTHFLVSLGSALMMIVSIHGFSDAAALGDWVKLDPSRVAAGVVSGIGFIGAGTIMMNKQAVRGLTTAAGIWVACGIGLAVGGGLYVLGVLAAGLSVVGLEFLGWLGNLIQKRVLHLVFTVQDETQVPAIAGALAEAGYAVVASTMEKTPAHGFQVEFTLTENKRTPDGTIFRIIGSFSGTIIEKLE